MAEQAADDDVDAAEVACDTVYDAVETLADAIFGMPARSVADLAIKAHLPLARGAVHDLLHYRPDDLSRFVQEVREIAGR